MKTAFFGTPSIATHALAALHEVSEVVLVVSQPDRPQGRGMKTTPTPVKLKAESLGLRVSQPTKLRDGALVAELKELGVELAVVMAYGRILPKDLLDCPSLGCVNVHASLLPEYRGAAPIHWVLLDGKEETGLCLMQMDEGLDTGPILTTLKHPLSPNCSAQQLTEELGQLSYQFIQSEIPRLIAGELQAIPQQEALASHARPISKEDYHLNFSANAEEELRRIHTFAPKPGAKAQLAGKRLAITAAKLLSANAKPAPNAPPGSLIRCDKGGVVVQFAQGQLEILRLQPEGKREMSASDAVNGRVLELGALLEPA